MRLGRRLLVSAAGAVASAVLALSGCVGDSAHPSKSASSSSAAATAGDWSDKGKLLRAPDGDTLRLQTDQHGELKVRLAGVDAPEHGQAYWRAAHAQLLVLVGKDSVTVHCQGAPDRYGRSICRVQTPTGDLGAQLLQAGLVWHYKAYANTQPASERELYARLEQEAQTAKRGLWQDADPMRPDLCRKAQREKAPCR